MAIQDSINQMLGTAAAAAFAANKTIGQDLDAKTKIDALNSQEQQLSKQMLEKHPRNEKGQFISQMEHQENISKKLTEVNKDLEMARKAQITLQQKQNLQTALRQATDKQISTLQTKRGLLGKVKANRFSWEEL